MMLHTMKKFLTYPFTPFPISLSSNLGRGSTSVLTFSTHPDSVLDKTQHPTEKATENVMSNSFVEGYASRSDEKGFEGASEGKQSTSKVEMDKFIHENHPAYDKAQRNEVKEKNKTRH
ncbi:hypothetical protein AAZX31_16G126100 [Glycine max]|uniref:Uncharacterized protein n=2 Tax=Glycine subgen. Soja TaxID=1462606 RepID=K7MHA5_SOYBN|nr:uncharacterized protein LOC114390087 [Glycine soja]KAG4939302.1 hypothetical protein JHK86_045443 [Glycine max]KAG4952156.1 hypothetical protein JHK85_046023 [Glycine max]KAG5099973.1 hypothetical protein JHK82_045025 [Glycine max]KAG5108575.1 hypothetical protein JHK84_045482 [Glycine max]KAH1151370.1 hypothetical protein GYH30_045059 [Glycine max]|eukprot:XP_006599384.2 uncharacterized protein LOC102663424 [Glycine max]